MKPVLLDLENVWKIYQMGEVEVPALKGVSVQIKKGDFVYLDPPYFPEKETSFVNYTSSGFTLDTHTKLFNAVKNLDKNKIQFVMNNAKVDFVLKHFKNFPYKDIIARRAIHSKKPGTKVTEILIYNEV